MLLKERRGPIKTTVAFGRSHSGEGVCQEARSILVSLFYLVSIRSGIFHCYYAEHSL